jgi:hypothetical protein
METASGTVPERREVRGMAQDRSTGPEQGAGPERDAGPGRGRELRVDGERFTVTERDGSPGVYDFAWESGPNEGYGFTSAVHGADALDTGELIDAARNFLEQVDPATGYIGD